MTPIRFKHVAMPLIALPADANFSLAFDVAVGYDPGDVSSWRVGVSRRSRGGTPSWSSDAVDVAGQMISFDFPTDTVSDDDDEVTLADIIELSDCRWSLSALDADGVTLWIIQGDVTFVADTDSIGTSAALGSALSIRLDEETTISLTILGNTAGDGGGGGSMTAAEILTAIKTVDGASSGLDADLLDGQQASAFASAAQGVAGAAAKTKTDFLTVTASTDLDAMRTKLSGIAESANNYTLPAPTTTVLGGVKRNTGSAGQFVTGIDAEGNLERGTPSGSGDALVASTLDQFADVTQTSGATLAISASTTLNGGTHSGTNTGDQDLSAYATLDQANAAADAAASSAAFALSSHAAETSSVHGISNFGATVVGATDAAAARTAMELGTAATTSSGDYAASGHTHAQLHDALTLSGTPDYITISGQVLTRNQIDLTTDVTGVLPIANFATGTPTGSKFVRDDGTLQSIPGGGDALVANSLDQFADVTQSGGATLAISASTTLNGGTHSGTNSGDNAVNSLYSGLVSNATHTGDVTGSTALTLATVNSNVGSFGSATQSTSITVNAKGLVTAASSATITPAVGSITGLGTGVGTALAVNVGSAGAPVLLNGAGGTPSSLTLTNATGLPNSSVVGLGGAALLSVGTTAGTVAAGDHLHDGRYYTEAEVDALLLAKASATAPYWVEVVLTPAGVNIATGAKVAMMTHMQAGTITGLKTVCDPANEPSAASVEVDMNSINLSTGAATSRLSSVASIATGANVSTGGAISGTQTVAVGDQSSFDIDQGSDGKELRALVQITPS